MQAAALFRGGTIVEGESCLLQKPTFPNSIGLIASHERQRSVFGKRRELAALAVDPPLRLVHDRTIDYAVRGSESIDECYLVVPCHSVAAPIGPVCI